VGFTSWGTEGYQTVDEAIPIQHTRPSAPSPVLSQTHVGQSQGAAVPYQTV